MTLLQRLQTMCALHERKNTGVRGFRFGLAIARLNPPPPPPHAGIGFLVGVFFSAADMAFAPLVVFMLILPLYLLSFRHLFFRSNFRNYISWLPGPLFFWAVVNGISWLVWCTTDAEHEWSSR